MLFVIRTFYFFLFVLFLSLFFFLVRELKVLFWLYFFCVGCCEFYVVELGNYFYCQYLLFQK